MISDKLTFWSAKDINLAPISQYDLKSINQ